MCIITKTESNPKLKEVKFVKSYKGSNEQNMTFFDDSGMSTTLKNYLKLTIIPYQDMLQWIFSHLIICTSMKVIVSFCPESIASMYKLHHILMWNYTLVNMGRAKAKVKHLKTLWLCSRTFKRYGQ